MSKYIEYILALSLIFLWAGAIYAGAPAARTGDMHTCPMITGVVPHVGGPILLCEPTVLICGMPAAQMGCQATCVGPPDQLSFGSGTVLIGGMPAVRQGDMTAHSGVVIGGCATVLIGN